MTDRAPGLGASHAATQRQPQARTTPRGGSGPAIRSATPMIRRRRGHGLVRAIPLGHHLKRSPGHDSKRPAALTPPRSHHGRADGHARCPALSAPPAAVCACSSLAWHHRGPEPCSAESSHVPRGSRSTRPYTCDPREQSGDRRGHLLNDRADRRYDRNSNGGNDAWRKPAVAQPDRPPFQTSAIRGVERGPGRPRAVRSCQPVLGRQMPKRFPSGSLR